MRKSADITHDKVINNFFSHEFTLEKVINNLFKGTTSSCVQPFQGYNLFLGTTFSRVQPLHGRLILPRPSDAGYNEGNLKAGILQPILDHV